MRLRWSTELLYILHFLKTLKERWVVWTGSRLFHVEVSTARHSRWSLTWDCLHRPAGHASLDTALDIVGLLGYECAFPAYVQLFIHPYPQVLLCRAALNLFILQSVLMLEIAPLTQVRVALQVALEANRNNFMILMGPFWPELFCDSMILCILILVSIFEYESISDWILRKNGIRWLERALFKINIAFPSL